MTKSIEMKSISSPKWIGIIILLVLTAVVAVFGSDIESALSEDKFDNDTLGQIMCHVPTVLLTIVTFFVAWVINLVLQFILDHLAKGSKQVVTAVKLVKSLIKYIIFIAAIMFILKEWGVDTTTLIASAGILSLIIGLGAQSLIADIIAGLFMVFENDFEVGDIVVIDGWRGTVLEIGMRTTKLVDTGGNIKIVNNSKISTVINQTKRLSIAKCYIGVEYGDSLPRVELVIRDNLDHIKSRIPQIVNGPYYKGVDSLGDSSVNLLFMADCKEEDIYIVQRAMNREFKIMFDENGINIPYPQIVVNQPTEINDVPADHRTRREARDFADEQSEKSKDMEEAQN